MRGLIALVVTMGVLIVAGTAVVGVTILRRMGVSAPRPTASTAAILPADLLLKEPTGSHMIAIAPAGERLAILLQGGGPDRVIILDGVTSAPVGRITLSQ